MKIETIMKSTFEIRAFIEHPEDGIQSWPLNRMGEIPNGYKIEHAIYLNLPNGEQQWLSDLNFTVESFKLFTETGFDLVEKQAKELEDMQTVALETMRTLKQAVGSMLMYKGHYEDMVELVESGQKSMKDYLNRPRLVVP